MQQASLSNNGLLITCFVNNDAIPWRGLLLLFFIILCLMIWSLMGTLAFHFTVTDFPVRNPQCSPRTSMNKCLLSGDMSVLQGSMDVFILMVQQ